MFSYECYIFPIRLPLFLLIKLGEITDKILDIIDDFVWKIIHKIADIFKFEEIAKEQYETNKEKFKDLY